LHNKSLAAKLLGIDRSVLRRKLQRYGLLDDGE
jgi:DNA-binding protein Fis